MACPYLNDNEPSEDKVMEYSDYLGVHTLLGLQKLESEKHGKKAHDEHLFMIVHQAFELWFKQMIVEMDSVIVMMSSHLNERNTLIIIQRLNRVQLILKLQLDQFPILETMTPHAFMDFREFLAPASGFQSWQFRVLENKFGMKSENRVPYQQKTYRETFSGNDKALNHIDASTDGSCLFETVMRWLERTPGVADNNSMWNNFQKACIKFLDDKFKKPYEEEKDEQEKASKKESYEKQKETFDMIFDEEKYERSRRGGTKRFTHDAFKGAMLINVYRDEPRFQLPFQLLTSLMDIDSLLMRWRYMHALIVQRMIGTKVGTASSSGYRYLQSTMNDKYKVFLDLLNLSTYMLPTEYIPPLEPEMRDRLAFNETSLPKE